MYPRSTRIKARSQPLSSLIQDPSDICGSYVGWVALPMRERGEGRGRGVAGVSLLFLTLCAYLSSPPSPSRNRCPQLPGVPFSQHGVPLSLAHPAVHYCGSHRYTSVPLILPVSLLLDVDASISPHTMSGCPWKTNCPIPTLSFLPRPFPRTWESSHSSGLFLIASGLA